MQFQAIDDVYIEWQSRHAQRKRPTEWAQEDAQCALPGGSDVLHEQDAGVHVDIDGGGTEAAVGLAQCGGVGGIVCNAQWQEQTEQEVGSSQVLQVHAHT